MRQPALRLALALSLAVSGTALAESVLHMPSKVDFAESAVVPQAVQTECALPFKMAQFIEQYSLNHFDHVKTVEAAPAKGQYLKVEIAHVEGAGGGAWSGAKSVTLRGSLIKDGKPGASFMARRVSGGGAFGGFKGTCDILGRNLQTLGQDVANWLSNPVDGARLGNL